MGSTCEPNVKVIDASVGGLVWVRRRNGSWWPGRIMGLEELSEDCLVSPRSGTPVKLLGREDASVDWYNLEKSKRVKAFRCGEYDECIEKAKASAANSSKQAVKYARREDAILHALELEAARKSNIHKEICLKSDNCTRAKESQELSGANKDNEYMNPNDGLIEGNPTQELSQSGISFEDPNHANTHKVYFMLKKRRKTPNDSEDDGTEGAKRMRGLEDLGMGVKSKRWANMHLQRDESHENVKVESVSLCESNIGNSLCNGSPVNSSKRYDSSLKRRRYQVANAYENLKRKNRRRQLTKVLESSMVAVPIVCDDGAIAGGSSFHGVTDSKVSVVESTESKKSSVSVVINNNSESTGASCEKEASLNASEHSCDAGVAAGGLHPELKDNEFSSMSEFPEDDSSDGLFDVPFVGEDKHTGGFSSLPASHSSLKLQSGAVGRPSNHCSQVGLISLRNEGLDESGSTTITHTNNANRKMEEGTSKWQSKGKRNSRFHSNKTRKSDLSDAFLEGEPGDGFSQWRHETSIEYGRSSENREITARKDSPAFSRAKYIGITPTTQVRNKESILPRHMRVSSLMSQKSLPHYRSRFTDHSSYAPTRNVYSDPFLFDVKLEVQASYRGRHVPLVSLMSKLNGKAIIGHPITVEVLDDGYSNCLMSSIDGCPTSSYSPKKSPKTKKCGLLSRKMRKLSSFSLPHEPKRGERELLVEKASGPVVACVPLKVVFSRISEAVKLSTRPTLCTSNSTNP